MNLFHFHPQTAVTFTGKSPWVARGIFGPTQAWEAVINQQGRDRTGSPDDLAGKTGSRVGGFPRGFFRVGQHN